jgi:hypothetical protein
VGLDGVGIGPRLVEPELARVLVGRVDGEDDVATLAGVDARDVGQQQVADSLLATLLRTHPHEVRHCHGHSLVDGGDPDAGS